MSHHHRITSIYPTRCSYWSIYALIDSKHSAEAWVPKSLDGQKFANSYISCHISFVTSTTSLLSALLFFRKLFLSYFHNTRYDVT